MTWPVLFLVFAGSVVLAGVVLVTATATAGGREIGLGSRQGALNDEQERFLYGAVEGVLKRSVDDLRFVASLLSGLLASQVVLLVFVADKAYGGFPVAALDAGIGFAAVGLVAVGVAREGPAAVLFAREFERDPRGTMLEIAEQLALASRFNGAVAVGLYRTFFVSLAFTMVAVAAVAVSGVH